MTHSTASQVLHRRPFRKALIALLATCAILAFIIVPVEMHQGNIQSVEDGMWWAITTASGVGYGDRYPVTSLGRVLGAILQLTGVMTFGVIIGLIGEVINKRQEDLYWSREFERFNYLEKKLESIDKKLQYLVLEQAGQDIVGSPEEAQGNRE